MKSNKIIAERMSHRDAKMTFYATLCVCHTQTELSVHCTYIYLQIAEFVQAFSYISFVDFGVTESNNRGK